MPVYSSVIDNCPVEKKLHRFSSMPGVNQPGANQLRYAENGIIIGPALVMPGMAKHVIPAVLRDAHWKDPSRNRAQRQFSGENN